MESRYDEALIDFVRYGPKHQVTLNFYASECERNKVIFMKSFISNP